MEFVIWTLKLSSELWRFSFKPFNFTLNLGVFQINLRVLQIHLMEFVTWMTFLIEQWTISFKPLSILLVVKKPGFKTSLQKRGGPGKEVGRSQDYTNHPIFKKVLDFTKYSVTWEISIKILRGLVSRLLALTPIFSVGGLEEVFLQDLLRLTPVLYHISSTRVMSYHSDITTNSHRLFFDAFINSWIVDI